jgi:hypothetical protein
VINKKGRFAMGTNQKTKEVLASMLTENTGSSILDSGGTPKYDENGKYVGSQHGYGRNCERQRGKTVADFEKEPEAVLDCRHGEISVTLNVYHWLASRLEYNEAADREFQEFADRPENEREGWLQIIEMYLENLKDEAENGRPCCHECEDTETEVLCDGDCPCHNRPAPAGIYGEGDPLCVNTYNGEDLLSQTIQYYYWTEGDSGSREVHVLLQIHGGADVRGGYTRPRFFDVTGDDGTEIFDNARATICCDNDKCTDKYGQTHHWVADDGCNWAPDGCYGRDYTNLEDVESIEASNELAAEAWTRYGLALELYKAQLGLFGQSEQEIRDRIAGEALTHAEEQEDVDEDEAKIWTLVHYIASGGQLFRYTEEGEGFCPVCKSGKLRAWFF